jgi:hypothetical protein
MVTYLKMIQYSKWWHTSRLYSTLNGDMPEAVHLNIFLRLVVVGLKQLESSIEELPGEQLRVNYG